MQGETVNRFIDLLMPVAAKQTPPVPSLAPLLELTAPAMVAVNQVILERLQSEVGLIPELAGHLIAAGGKRMRPMLTLAGALCTGQAEPQEPPQAALLLAAAVEFIHNATLLHDDVIDASGQRRGRETANAIWGNQASVLVGDFLFASAFELMVESGDIEVLGLLASASARITEAEVRQMVMTGQPDADITDYMTVISGKTAVLFAAAAEAGARVAGASRDQAAALYEYGLHLGRAFQMMDDALDYTAPTDQMGKNTGDDFAEGKITLPVILAWQKASREEQAFLSRAFAGEESRDGDFAEMQALLSRHDSIEQALQLAAAEADQAIAALDKLPASELVAALASAAAFAAARQS